MKRLKKITSALLDVDEKDSLDLDLLDKNLTKDFSDVTNRNIYTAVTSAKNLGIDVGIFNNAEYVCEMDDIEKVLVNYTKADIINAVLSKRINIKTDDTYAILYHDGSISSTSDDLEKEFNALAEKVYDKVVSATKAGKFDDVYNNYDLSGIDKALVRK